MGQEGAGCGLEGPEGVEAVKHAPRWPYDCKNCKFNWCCGPTCSCHYTFHVDDEKAGQPNDFAQPYKLKPTPPARLRAVRRKVQEWREERGYA